MTPSATEFASLSGLRACVTGSSSGIGREIALEFARAGARVFIHANTSRTAAAETVTEINALGCEAACETADFSNTEVRTEFIEAAWSRWNGFDIWVNNAGVDLLTGSGKDLDYHEKLETLLAVDVSATIACSREVARRMREDAERNDDVSNNFPPVVLNIGWDQADRGMEGDSGELFAVAKSAVMAFTRSFALSVAPHVRVNCIAPGWIKTAWGETASDYWQTRVMDETPLKRWGLPSDIAALARFLTSREASFLTGQVINCNGGAVR